jgi:hypothetical protein
VGGISIGGNNNSLSLTGFSTSHFTHGKMVGRVNATSSSDFAKNMMTMSNKDLAKILCSPGLNQDRKTEIATELLRRMEAYKAAILARSALPGGDASADESPGEKRIQKLLNKMKDGELSPAEMKELVKLLRKESQLQDITQGDPEETEFTV